MQAGRENYRSPVCNQLRFMDMKLNNLPTSLQIDIPPSDRLLRNLLFDYIQAGWWKTRSKSRRNGFSVLHFVCEVRESI